jgi:hypothetical protein
MSSGEGKAPQVQSIHVADMSSRRRGGRWSTPSDVVGDVDDVADVLDISCR